MKNIQDTLVEMGPSALFLFDAVNMIVEPDSETPAVLFFDLNDSSKYLAGHFIQHQGLADVPTLLGATAQNNSLCRPSLVVGSEISNNVIYKRWYEYTAASKQKLFMNFAVTGSSNAKAIRLNNKGRVIENNNPFDVVAGGKIVLKYQSGQSTYNFLAKKESTVYDDVVTIECEYDAGGYYTGSPPNYVEVMSFRSANSVLVMPDGTATFHVTIPESGTYRVFIEGLDFTSQHTVMNFDPQIKHPRVFTVTLNEDGSFTHSASDPKVSVAKVSSTLFEVTVSDLTCTYIRYHCDDDFYTIENIYTIDSNGVKRTLGCNENRLVVKGDYFYVELALKTPITLSDVKLEDTVGSTQFDVFGTLVTLTEQGSNWVSLKCGNLTLPVACDVGHSLYLANNELWLDGVAYPYIPDTGFVSNTLTLGRRQKTWFGENHDTLLVRINNLSLFDRDLTPSEKYMLLVRSWSFESFMALSGAYNRVHFGNSKSRVVNCDHGSFVIDYKAMPQIVKFSNYLKHGRQFIGRGGVHLVSASDGSTGASPIGYNFTDFGGDATLFIVFSYARGDNFIIYSDMNRSQPFNGLAIGLYGGQLRLWQNNNINDTGITLTPGVASVLTLRKKDNLLTVTVYHETSGEVFSKRTATIDVVTPINMNGVLSTHLLSTTHEIDDVDVTLSALYSFNRALDPLLLDILCMNPTLFAVQGLLLENNQPQSGNVFFFDHNSGEYLGRVRSDSTGHFTYREDVERDLNITVSLESGAQITAPVRSVIV